MPPTHSPFRLDAEILSRMRSEVTSRSNWANESSALRRDSQCPCASDVDQIQCSRHFRFAPENGFAPDIAGVRFSAKRRHSPPCSIISSARVLPTYQSSARFTSCIGTRALTAP
jgi:hypothetical protein